MKYNLFPSTTNKILSKLLALAIIILVSGDLMSQSSLESLIDNAKTSNKTLQTAQQLNEAELIGAKTGNSPDNPQIEYAYLWGSPDQIGNRTDFEISQSFDFPTAYSSRSKLSRIKRDQSNLKLAISEQIVITQLWTAWAEAVYLNKKEILLRKRLDNAQRIFDAFQRLFDEGEANILQLNQAKLQLTSLSYELEDIALEVISNNASLSRMSGGDPYMVTDTVFPVSNSISLDSIIIWYRTGPQNMIYQGEVVRSEQQKTVVFNQKLPKLKAGYYQENILGTKLSGIRAGVTIPLWENANAVKSAKADFVYAQTDAIRFWEQQQLNLGRLHGQRERLISKISEMEYLLGNANNDDLLFKALENGEISLSQYHYELDLYLQTKFDLLEFERKLQLIDAQLLSIKYL